MCVITNIWTSGYTHRSYINIVCVYLNANKWAPNTMLLDFLPFDAKKTALNIKEKISIVFSTYSLSMDNTPIVMDTGANILAATSSNLRLVCACHRLNTTIQNSIDDTKEDFPVFKMLLDNCNKLVTFVKSASGIQPI